MKQQAHKKCVGKVTPTGATMEAALGCLAPAEYLSRIYGRSLVCICVDLVFRQES